MFDQLLERDGAVSSEMSFAMTIAATENMRESISKNRRNLHN